MGWIIGLAVLMAGGVVLFCLGWKGRRVGEAPFCAECGFDLRGKPEESKRCAECGSELGRTGAVVVGERWRRRGLVWSGVLVILLGGLLLGGTGYVVARGVEVIRYVPLWILEREIASGSPNEKAGAEIVRRVRDGELMGAKLEGLVDRVLTVHGDDKSPWNHCYEKLISAAADQGALTDSQVERLFWDCYEEKVECKPRLRAGGYLPIRFYVNPRREVPGLDWKVVGRSTLTVGKVPLRIFGGLVGWDAIAGNRTELSNIYHAEGVPTGAQFLKYTMEYDVALGGGHAKFRREVRKPMEVIAEDAKVDEWAEDAATQAKLMRALSVNVDVDGEDLVWQLRLNKPGINLAMDLWLIENSQASIRKGSPFFVEKNGEDRVMVWRESLRGTVLNRPMLQLTPSQFAAETHLYRVDRYWGRNVVFQDIKVGKFEKARYFNMDESLRAGVEKSITASLERTDEGKLEVELDCNGPPVDLQFALVLRRGAQDFVEGQDGDFPVGQEKSWSTAGEDLGVELAKGEKVDVILRPCLNADYNPAKPPWGGEVVIKGLVVP